MIWVEEHEISIETGGQAPLGLAQTDKARWSRGNPVNHFGKTMAAPCRLSPGGAEAELKTAHPAPSFKEGTMPLFFEIWCARRVIRHHAVDRATGEAEPEFFPICRLADRRGAFETGIASMDLLGAIGPLNST